MEVRDLPGLPMITVKLLPVPSKIDYPLDVIRTVAWLWDGRAPRRQASHPLVIRGLAKRGNVVFTSDGKFYTSKRILELIDEDGQFTGEDPRPDPTS